MNLVILSNAQPLSGSGLLQRTSSLTPLLLPTPEDTGHEEAVGGWSPLRAFVTDPLAWQDQALDGEVEPIRSFPAVLGAIRALRPDSILIDFDPTAGRGRDRVAFLQMAGTLAVTAAVEGWSFGLASSDKSLPGGDVEFFPGHVLSTRQLLTRLAERCHRRITFSPGAARRLGKRFRRPFEVLPVPALVPSCTLSRREARNRLGLPEKSEELLVGVAGRFSDTAWDFLQAALKETLRLSPGARLLYLGPDGGKFRERQMPMPFLDAGSPQAAELAVRLRALDLAVLPVKGGCRMDDQFVLGCLRNGTPVVATVAAGGRDAGFNHPPEGLGMVPEKELGAFLEAIEIGCERAMSGNDEPVGAGLRAYYAANFAAPRMHRFLVGGGNGERVEAEGSASGFPSILQDD